MTNATGPIVLYVDDDLVNVRVFEANFRSAFNVLGCGTAKEALEIVAQRSNEICVLISDQRMPGMTGVELLERARNITPDIQRMIITAYSDMEAVMDAVNRGQVTRYFVKPWVREDLVVAFGDAVQIHNLQSKLREVEVRMLNSERLAALGQVSAGVAHELMGPVTYVSQNVEHLRIEVETIRRYIEPMLAKFPAQDVKQVLTDLPGLLDDLETGARHIREVAVGLRSQARGDDVENTCDFSECAQFASKIARAEALRRARLVVNGPSVQVRSGPVKLTRVLLNLIVNAAHAMEGINREGIIEITWREEGEWVLAQVKDNGSGIPKEIQEKIFEPLFTTKPAGIGTGLGLAICRDLMREMGGAITITSAVNVGTTVDLKLKKV